MKYGFANWQAPLPWDIFHARLPHCFTLSADLTGPIRGNGFPIRDLRIASNHEIALVSTASKAHTPGVTPGHFFCRPETASASTPFLYPSFIRVRSAPENNAVLWADSPLLNDSYTLT